MLLPHRLEFRASGHLACTLSLLHLAALSSIFLLQVSFLYKIGLATAAALSFGMSIRHHALLLAATSICELTLKADGAVEGVWKDGRRFDAGVSGQTTVLPGLIVILLEMPGRWRPYPLVIMKDSLPAEDRRTLCAWLRWKLS